MASEALEHFMTLAKRGKHPGASGGEGRCFRLACALTENVPGVDDLAIAGMIEFIDFVQANPMEARDTFGETGE